MYRWLASGPVTHILQLPHMLVNMAKAPSRCSSRLSVILTIMEPTVPRCVWLLIVMLAIIPVIVMVASNACQDGVTLDQTASHVS